MALIVPADHRWGKRKVVPFSQFAREPLVVREPGSGSRWCLEQALSTTAKSLRDVNVVLELGSNEAIKEAVLKGIGITVLSTRAVQKECASGRLHTLAIAGLSLERWLFLVRDTRRALPNTGRVFANFLESTGPNLAVQ
jgi:DNA-binding transcriptional LysR family regulator